MNVVFFKDFDTLALMKSINEFLILNPNIKISEIEQSSCSVGQQTTSGVKIIIFIIISIWYT